MVRHGTWGSSLRHIKPVTLLRFARTSKRNAYLVDLYPQIDSGVISSYHNYASCFFFAMMCGKLCEVFVIVTSLS